jgi:hypothetical protein
MQECRHSWALAEQKGLEARWLRQKAEQKLKARAGEAQCSSSDEGPGQQPARFECEARY